MWCCFKWLGCRCLGHTSLDGNVPLHGCSALDKRRLYCGLLLVFCYAYCNFSHHETSQETSTRHSRSFREPSRTAAAALGPAGRCASEAGRLRSSAKSGGAWPEAMPLSAGRGTSPHSGTSRLCGTRKGGTTRGCASFGPAWHLPRSGPRWFRGKRNGSTARGCASIGLMPRGLCTVRGCASVGPRANPCTPRAQPPRLGFARTVSPC